MLSAPALAASGSENAPVHLGTSTTSSGGSVGGGGSIVRTIVGLAVVIGVIYGIAWVLRQVKQSRAEKTIGGLSAVASVPLGSGRSLQLVRVGSELVLVGVADHGVTPVRSYSEQEAREAGLIDEWGELILPEELVAASTTGSALKLRAPRDVVQLVRKWTVRR
ncbi:MAG TPA: flagellar biosynthetic protein FliO [Conexibacter sp.]|jgi:flagellar protein FliO/FliZ